MPASVAAFARVGFLDNADVQAQFFAFYADLACKYGTAMETATA